MLKITPYNDKHPKKRMKQGQLTELFDDFLGVEPFVMRNLKYDSFKLNVKEEDDKYMIEAELPGIKKDEVFIDYYNGNLSISIEHEEMKNEEAEKYIYRESMRSSMRRTIEIGDVHVDSIIAELKDGILLVTAPKATISEKSKRIEIK